MSAIRRLKDRGSTIKLFWIKAHVGHERNERADRIAKETTEIEPREPIEPPLSCIKMLARKKMRKDWIDWW